MFNVKTSINNFNVFPLSFLFIYGVQHIKSCPCCVESKVSVYPSPQLYHICPGAAQSQSFNPVFNTQSSEVFLTTSYIVPLPGLQLKFIYLLFFLHLFFKSFWHNIIHPITSFESANNTNILNTIIYNYEPVETVQLY